MSAKSSAWGHTIGPIVEYERFQDRAVREVIASLGQSVEAPVCRQRECSSGLRCPGKYIVTVPVSSEYGHEYTYTAGAPAVYMASYLYVSGRQGNVSQRDLYLCQPCAAKFAKRNKLALPASEGRPA